MTKSPRAIRLDLESIHVLETQVVSFDTAPAQPLHEMALAPTPGCSDSYCPMHLCLDSDTCTSSWP